MLLLGAWQGERISLLAVTQHPPSALETELAASTLMAATTLRIITKLMFDPPQFHLLPSAACSSSWLLPTTSAVRTPAGHPIVSIMAASTLRIITELMFGPPQVHLRPSSACSSPRLLPTTSAISAIRARWSPTLRAIAATAPPLRTLLVMLPQPLMPVSRPPVTCQNGVHLPKSLMLRLLNVQLTAPAPEAVLRSAGVPHPTIAAPATLQPATPSSRGHTGTASTTSSSGGRPGERTSRATISAASPCRLVPLLLRPHGPTEVSE